MLFFNLCPSSININKSEILSKCLIAWAHPDRFTAQIAIYHTFHMNSPSSTDTAEHGGDSSHHPGGHWFQNQVSSTDPRSVASGYQLLLQRFLDHPRLQAHARLPQV